MITEGKIRDWYNKKHTVMREKAWRPYEAYPVFLKYLNVKPGKNLLDIGCGTGYLLRAANAKKMNTYGVDISDKAIEITKKESPNSVVFAGEGESLSFESEKFNYITCLGALEHFLDMNKALQEMKRVAKRDARFLIMVPNVNNHFWKKSGKFGTAQQDINERLFSLQEWKNIFLKNGFKILHIYQDRWFMKNIKIFSSLNPLKIMKRLIGKLEWLLLPLDKTYQFIFIMQKDN